MTDENGFVDEEKMSNLWFLGVITIFFGVTMALVALFYSFPTGGLCP